MSPIRLTSMDIIRKPGEIPEAHNEAQMWRQLGQDFEEGASSDFICLQVTINEGNADYLDDYFRRVTRPFVRDAEGSDDYFVPLSNQDWTLRYVDTNRAMFCYLVAEMIEDGTLDILCPGRWRDLRKSTSRILTHVSWRDEPTRPLLWSPERYIVDPDDSWVP